MGRTLAVVMLLSVVACEQEVDYNSQVVQHIVCFTPDGQLLFRGQTDSADYTRGLWIVTMNNRVLTTNGQCMQEIFKVVPVEPDKEAEQSHLPPPDHESEKAARGPVDEDTRKQSVHPWEGSL